MTAVRCNPYGHGTDAGPKQLLGGVYSAAYEGRYKWECKNRADGMFRFVCANGHKGAPQALCYGHVREIQRRMSEFCPPCAYPPEARSLVEAIERDQNQLGQLKEMGLFGSRAAQDLRVKIESMAARMTELAVSGRTPKVAGRWEEVS
jgi:hypothetical protein